MRREGRGGQNSDAPKQARSSRWVVAVALLLLLSLSGSAYADSPPAGPAYTDYLESIEDTQEGIQHQLTDEDAAAELPHRDLNRDEALTLLREVFARQLEEPAGPFDELEVIKLLSDDVAVIETEGGGEDQERVLLDSTVPLRPDEATGDSSEVISLALENDGSELQPANPLIDVGIPLELGEGIVFPGADVRIVPQGVAPERAPSIAEQSVAFYPNVAPDTDLVLAPTLGGVESLTQLRSPDAPSTETFQVELPAGASLLPSENGGATVQDAEGKTLLSISPPSALDASGESVPVSLEVSGDSFVQKVSVPENAQYPILVDPIINEYFWGPGNTTAGLNDWKYKSNNLGSYWPTTWANCGTSCYSGLPWGWPGLYIGANVEGGAWPGAETEWNYYVPRWQEDWNKLNHAPTSYIESMYLWNVGYWYRADPNLSPYLVMGIWRPTIGGWTSHETWSPAQGALNQATGFKFTTAYMDYESKMGVFALVSTDYHLLKSYRDAYLGYAQVAVSDPDNPSFGSIGPAPQWVNNKPTSPIPFTVSDPGLGIYSLTVTDKQTPAHSWVTSAGCSGGAEKPCPLTWKSTDAGKPALSYDPAVLPQGTNTLKVTARDPVGHEVSANAQVKVDHTAPSVALSGTMTEQATLGTKRPNYTLEVASTDGTEGASQSGVASTEVTIDGKKVDSTAAGCATSNCSVTREWTLSSLTYSTGKHVVVAKTTDSVGLSTEKTLNIEIQRDTTAPTITEVGGALRTAPEGWVEQNSYGLSAKATDADFGITSLTLKIDGTVVKTVTQGCGGGACKGQLSATVNMANYKGGEHSAEVLVKDGAGNSSSQSWTTNVNPKGSIPASEAIKTLDASDATSDSTIVAATAEVISAGERADGNDPGLVQTAGEGLSSTGTPVTSTATTDPSDGFTLKSTDGNIQVAPVGTSEGATNTAITEGVAGVSGNVTTDVDDIIRPIFNGVMDFRSIRSFQSPEEFSWKVELYEGQTIKAIDAKHLEVSYSDGTLAMTINAEPARDATGAAVDTVLSISGKDTITLKVGHKSPSVVYPVVAGSAFQIGYTMPLVINPPVPAPSEEEAELFGTGTVGIGVSAPVWSPGEYDPEGGAEASKLGGAYHTNFDGYLYSSFPILGDEFWNQHIKGFFWHDNKHVWWRKAQPNPSCAQAESTVNISLSVQYCNWIGPNHQKYGGGYHISAQLQVTVFVDAILFNKTKYNTLTVYMYGSGYWNAHVTDCVCNPLPKD